MASLDEKKGPIAHVEHSPNAHTHTQIKGVENVALADANAKQNPSLFTRRMFMVRSAVQWSSRNNSNSSSFMDACSWRHSILASTATMDLLWAQSIATSNIGSTLDSPWKAVLQALALSMQSILLAIWLAHSQLDPRPTLLVRVPVPP